MNGPPKISSKYLKNAVVGENVEIECKVNTFPSIKRIVSVIQLALLLSRQYLLNSLHKAHTVEIVIKLKVS